MPLSGLAIGGYRSFGPDAQFIGPLTKINFVAGPNNSGKSNILRFVAEHLRTIIGERGRAKFKELDKPLQGQMPFTVGLALSKVDDRVRAAQQLSDSCARQIDAMFRFPQLTRSTGECGIIWFVKTSTRINEAGSYDWDLPELERSCGRNDWWQELWNKLTKTSGGDYRSWIGESLERLSPFSAAPPRVAMIDAIRQVLPGEVTENDHSGRGLIKRLALLQHPPYDQQLEKERFQSIEAFLQDVTGNPSARLEIPHTHDSITVLMDGKALPLESLGTGVHEVIILAAASTVLSDHVICMEEPEIHLHPIYQRKLLRYLNKNTSNQYLICTHSPHLLDSPEASVFHVSMEGGHTQVRFISTSGHRWNLARELGARASDVVQAITIRSVSVHYETALSGSKVRPTGSI